jgi:hypothetical protein
MYIGEGYKRSRNVVALANSDPKVICLASHWIRRFSKNTVKYQVHHHADQDPVSLVAFWSAGLGVDPYLISSQRKSNSGRLSGRTWRCEYGVLSVRAKRHLVPRPTAGMDGSHAGGVVRLDLLGA